MSWQADVYARLRQAPGERWVRLGELFEEVQQAIPLHYAMRLLVRQSASDERRKGDFARWRYFKQHVVRMNLERIGTSRSWVYNDRVRLREVAGRTCGNCGGPVVWATWKSKTKVACLRCEAPQSVPLPSSRRGQDEGRVPVLPGGPNHCLPAATSRALAFSTVRQFIQSTRIQVDPKRPPPHLSSRTTATTKAGEVKNLCLTG